MKCEQFAGHNSCKLCAQQLSVIYVNKRRAREGTIWPNCEVTAWEEAYGGAGVGRGVSAMPVTHTSPLHLWVYVRFYPNSLKELCQVRGVRCQKQSELWWCSTPLTTSAEFQTNRHEQQKSCFVTQPTGTWTQWWDVQHWVLGFKLYSSTAITYRS